MIKWIIFGLLVVICIWGNYRLEEERVNARQDSTQDQSIETSAKEPEVERAAAAIEPPNQETVVTKVELLKEILASKNDNDPRMDTELKDLTAVEKDALVEVYRDLRAEKLNDKGTIVFLVGRELNRPEDAEFLKSVLSEEPCLSLDNCGITNPETDPHMDSVNNVTLNYPQMVALNRIKTFLQTQDLQTINPGILSHLIDATKIGQSSDVGMIKNASNEIAEILESKK